MKISRSGRCVHLLYGFILFVVTTLSANGFHLHYNGREANRSSGTPTFLSKSQPQKDSRITRLHVFDKLFQESGALGKGVTVGKVQVALNCKDRGKGSIFAFLGSEARSMSDDPYDLATLCRDVCLELLRKREDWIAAASTSEWFKGSDGGKAESLFNTWANAEDAKFEKKYIPERDEEAGGPTIAVVSIVVEIEGDETKFDGAGYSFSGTQEILSGLASDVMVQDGDCLNAVEVFWTPSEPDEVLGKEDIILDFPELITL